MSTLYVDNLQPNLGSQVEIPNLKPLAGSVVQVQSFQQATGQVQVTASGVWTATGCTVSITPSSADSKVLVIVSGSSIAKNTASYAFRVQRNGTVVNRHEMYANDANYWQGDSVSLVCLDSPATTSSCSYIVEMYALSNGNNNHLRWNYANGVNSTSTITAMEIAQ